MDYKAQRKNSTYVEFDKVDETKLFGKYLNQVNIENDKGSKVTVFYYHSGIDKFDKITNNEPFYEYGLSFHLISFENAFTFKLFHDEKQLNVGAFGIWRDSIINNPTSEIFIGKVIYNNRFIGALKTGVLGAGAGIVGAAISVAGGTIISKLRGLKTEDAKVQLYNLQFKDNEEIKTIKVYKKDVFNSDNYFFIEEHYSNNLDSNVINSSDSRCFIATACYQSKSSDELIVFRNFRDTFLLNSLIGKILVNVYYNLSPYLIKLLSQNSKRNIKIYFLDKVYKFLKNNYGK